MINRHYRPGKGELVAAYYLEPNKIKLEHAAEHLAVESSSGTEDVPKKFKPTVFSMNKRTHVIKIAYPNELFEQGNAAQVLSTLAGNVLGLKLARNCKLLDISFPKQLITSFKGPRYGIAGIRKLSKISKRPLVGASVTPKVGLTPKQFAEKAFQMWTNGLDFVKDDDHLTNLNSNKFRERVKLTMQAQERAERETGERKLYFPNVTAETLEMLKRTKYVESLNNEHVMINYLTAGTTALQTLRNNTKCAIHVHRAMHGALTRNVKSGVSMLVLAKLARLLGADQLHIGSAGLGKQQVMPEEERAIHEALTNSSNEENERNNVLHQKWFSTKKTFPVASGGLHPKLIPTLLHITGNDIMLQVAHGVNKHPWGIEKGAKALRQTIEAATHKIPLTTYAKAHRELQEVLKS